ncbi:MAG: hypothetical protein V1822_01195 [Candidatus Micrarchaeota archaeon]
MEKISFENLLALAKDLNNQKKKWHFHLLPKGCIFNPEKEKFKIIFENEASKEVFCCLFVELPMGKSKELAFLLYGDDFLEQKGEPKPNKDFEALYKKAQEFSKEGAGWHHHHLPPNCIFSEHKKSHSLALEGPEGQTMSAQYANKPAGDLARIEKLFYEGV